MNALKTNQIAVTLADSIEINTDPVFQYSYGQQYVFSGSGFLPGLLHAEIAPDRAGSKAVSVPISNEGIADIPDELLTEGSIYLLCYIVLSNETQRTTAYVIKTPVLARPSI